MSLFKSASIVSLFTLLSRITGLVRDLLLAWIFGASALTDAFHVAFRIPNLLRRLFAEGAFSQAFVPVLSRTSEAAGKEATKSLIDLTATVLFSALLLTCIIGIIGAPLLVYALASGLSAEGFDAATRMTRFMFPYIACMSLVALSSGILNTYKNFAVPAATPILLNISMIFAAWLLAPALKARGIEPIYCLAAGVMLGGVLQLFVQVPALLKIGMLPRISLFPSKVLKAVRDDGVRRILLLMLPALLGVGVAQLSLLINTQIASHLAAGSVTWIGYADRLMEFPTALLGVALGVVLTPQLSKALAAGDNEKYSSMLDWGLRLVLLLGLPCAIALGVFALPLTATLFHHGKFSGHDALQSAAALSMYGIGILGLVGVKVLAPAYFANLDIKTPVKIAICVLIITQILNFILVPHFRHAALTLSIAISALINSAWLLRGLLMRGLFIPKKGWFLFICQVLAASLFMAAFLMWINDRYNWLTMQAFERVWILSLSVLFSAIIYFAALFIAGLDLKKLLKR